MTTTKNFWNRNHELSPDLLRLEGELVPLSGKADTLEGEFIRAIGRLGYDFYNNGFCNNTSDALDFLNREMPVEIITEYEFLKDYVNTGGYAPNYAKNAIDTHLTNLTEKVVRYVLSKEGNYTESDLDMFDYGDPDYYPEDEDDDWDWGDSDYDDEDEDDDWNWDNDD